MLDTVHANGVNIPFVMSGSGPVLMLIHSGESDHRLFDYIAPGLSECFTVLKYDQRDAGRSADAQSFYTMGDLADDAAGLMEALGISKAHVLGTAFGGMLAQELAVRHPQSIDRLILAGSAAHGDANDQARAKLSTYLNTSLDNDDPDVRKAANHFYNIQSPTFDTALIDSLIASRLRRDEPKRARRIHAVKKFNGLESSPRIRARTLILTAKEDQLVAPLESWKLAHLIPHATLLVLNEFGHHFYRQAPELTVHVITEFLFGRMDVSA